MPRSRAPLFSIPVDTLSLAVKVPGRVTKVSISLPTSGTGFQYSPQVSMPKQCIQKKLLFTPWLVDASQWGTMPTYALNPPRYSRCKQSALKAQVWLGLEPVSDPTLVLESICNGRSECVQGTSYKTGYSIIKIQWVGAFLCPLTTISWIGKIQSDRTASSVIPLSHLLQELEREQPHGWWPGH